MTPRGPRGLPFDDALVPGGSHTLVALSGGIDSLVLLHRLRFGRPDAAICAAHFDHAMRPSSAADARWVAGLCQAWEVEFEHARAAAPLAGEDAARRARYAFLRDVAQRRGAGRIATAHHLDDQAETVLHRAIRGSGVRGLRGIARRSGPLVRPLLGARRVEIEAYATAAGIRARPDPTNEELRYARNRIRHRVLPELERAHAGAAVALARLADNARSAEAALDALLEAVEKDVVTRPSRHDVQLARSRLLAYHPAVRLHLLRRLLRTFGSVPDRAGTQAALQFISSAGSGSGIELPGGVRLERSFGQFLLTAAAPGGQPSDQAVTITGVAGGGIARIGGARFRVRWGEAASEEGEACSFDPADLVFPLALRGWHDGDRIATPGGTKKLKKLFAERRVERRSRSRIPVVSDAGGRVLWVVGIARSAALPAPRRGSGFRITVGNVETA
jgi:tRNA(Ile)-lysidine synthase